MYILLFLDGEAAFPFTSFIYLLFLFPYFFPAFDISPKSVFPQQLLGNFLLISLLFILSHWWGSLGSTGDWKETQLGQVTQTDQRDIQAIWHYVQYKNCKRKKEEEGDIWSDDVCLEKSVSRTMVPCIPGDGWTPACPRKQRTTSLFCFARLCVSFAFLN